MNTDTTAPLILIGEAQHRFGDNFAITHNTRFKYIILQSPGSQTVQLLLMIPNMPYEHHAEAVFEYMQQNKFNDIIINGGGYVAIRAKDDVLFSGKSYAFGGAYPPELEALSKGIWPTLPVLVHLEENAVGPISEVGRKFTLAEIKWKVDHP